MKQTKVAVLTGGASNERPGSLRTGKFCAKQLREAGYDVHEIDVDDAVEKTLRRVKPDVAFIGGFGQGLEDGALQHTLETMGIPYTHSGVAASALAMDKYRSRELFRAQGLPVAEGRLIHRNEFDDRHPMDPPYIIKPNNEGSSVGVVLVKDTDSPVSTAPIDGVDWFMVEKYVPGLDLTAAIFENRGIGVCLFDTTADIYDAKLKKGIGLPCDRVVPAAIPDAIAQKCLHYAEVAHHALGCHIISRMDFRWDESRSEEGLVVLEVNTHPGMGSEETSIVKIFNYYGITPVQVCRTLVENPLNQRAGETSTI